MKTILAKLNAHRDVETFQVVYTPQQAKRASEACKQAWGENFRQYTPREFKKICNDQQRAEYNKEYSHIRAEKITCAEEEIPQRVGVFCSKKLVSKAFCSCGSESHLMAAYKFAANLQRTIGKKARVVALTEKARRMGYDY